ncbi:MAG: Ig-like domain repeat protein [Micromonosporaceae bacterium]|nr:Ig-like domain repeat protein [Micromonosporaceae bacterium]
MKAIHLKRPAVLVGLVAVAFGAVLVVSTAASAALPNPLVGQPGLVPSATSGGPNDAPTFTTTRPCATGTQTADVDAVDPSGLFGQQIGPSISGFDATQGPFTGTIVNMHGIQDAFGEGGTAAAYEIAIYCHALAGDGGTPLDYVIVDFKADGTWTMRFGSGPVQTQTSVSGPTNVSSNTNVTLTATVTPATAVGSVQFKDGSANLGGPVAVSGGTAQFSTATLADGPHPITAVFTPTDSTAFAPSTSDVFTVTVGGLTGTETITVNVPSSEGTLTLTVSPTAVTMSTAALSADNTTFESTGTLSDVTVNDGRNQSHPGWRASGQVQDFTGPATIDGNSLGWTPMVKTPNPALDISAGPAILPGTNPGLKQGSGLASAPAGAGLGTTVLSAGLDLKVPATQAAGNYSTTLTITLLPTA